MFPVHKVDESAKCAAKVTYPSGGYGDYDIERRCGLKQVPLDEKTSAYTRKIRSASGY